MQEVNNTRGFFTFAQNTNDVDYVRLAYGLALSLKHSQKSVSNISIGITPGTTVDPCYAWAFDQIIEIPWGDQADNSPWKLENEWKVPWMSPYDETIKLDCDMLFFSDIGTWWQNFSELDSPLLFANAVVDWRGDIIRSDACRKTFTANKLPNIYTAFTYFTKSPRVFEFYELAKIITWNWQRFFADYLTVATRPENFSTDVAFALAMKILDFDEMSFTEKKVPTFTHMKTELQGWHNRNLSDNWQDHITPFMSPLGSLKLGNHRQFYPLHYHVKSFLTDDMLAMYESLVKQ